MMLFWKETAKEFERIEVATCSDHESIPEEQNQIDISQPWQAFITLSQPWSDKEAIRSVEVHESMHFATRCALNNIPVV